MKKGVLIVFEGLDYSFKETNTKKLYNYIKENISDKVFLLSFPNYESESSIFVKNYLSGKYGNASEVDPYQSSIFYAMDRYDTIYELNIKEKLQEGYIVIMDRYIGSNLIFQSTKFNNDELINKYIDSITNFEYKLLDLPKEDIVIYMNMPVDISHKLMKERKLKSGDNVDGHEDNYEFMKNVETNAKKIINKLNYDIIDCIDSDNNIKSEDDIFNDILSKIKLPLDLINNKIKA